MTGEDPTPEEFMRMVEEAKKAEAERLHNAPPMTQAEQDALYLSSMRLFSTHYAVMEEQVAHLRKKIEAAPRYASPPVYTSFSGPDSPFSLEYPCHFTFQDLPFTSAEHALHYAKAKHFVDHDTARRISGAVDPNEIRALSNGVKNFYSPGLEQVWSGLLLAVNTSKFAFSPTLSQALAQTAGTILVEHDPIDHFLAPTHHDDFDADALWNTWIVAHNALGVVLTYLRVESTGTY